MIKVVGVSLSDSKQIYYFNPKNFDLKRNITVIVETERGLQFGKVELPPFEIDENILKSELKDVIRISTKKDYMEHKKNIKDSQEALSKCKQLVEKFELDMQIMDANFAFDRSQLVFRFLSESRVDFRKLAKELANCYKTRIELRQVGVRDKAKEVGGYGSCGRELCCSKFLCDFDSVSINMAKNQNIALNPTKINGVCGRLLCCLKYEDACYRECGKNLPKVGKKVETEFGEGKVISVDILKQKYKVDVKDSGIVEVDLNESS